MIEANRRRMRQAGETARRQLEDVVFPFWLSNGVDHELGGFFTCFDNRGRVRVSDKKYTWSQGRFVWLLARAAHLADAGLLDLDADALTSLAERGAGFIVDHALRPDNTCAFTLERTGEPCAGPNGETRSVYSDLFVAMGLCELARRTRAPAWLESAEAIIARSSDDIAVGVAPTPPYPVPHGFSAFGPKMILANSRLDQLRARRALAADVADVRADLARACSAMLSHRTSDGLFLEMIPGAHRQGNTLVARHRVPGHALEGLWVALEAAEMISDPTVICDIRTSVGRLCTSAWDSDHGGLFRYVDASGPRRPSGTEAGSPYEALVLRTWDTKLWWVHTEAAYTTALVAWRYGDHASAEWFERIWTYTLDTFPGGSDGDEWVQIRDRMGRPLDEVVALPVKDPFHITRSLMQLVELVAHGSP